MSTPEHHLPTATHLPTPASSSQQISAPGPSESCAYNESAVVETPVHGLRGALVDILDPPPQDNVEPQSAETTKPVSADVWPSGGGVQACATIWSSHSLWQTKSVPVPSLLTACQASPSSWGMQEIANEVTKLSSAISNMENRFEQAFHSAIDPCQGTAVDANWPQVW
jgi:hypothetical protein